MFLPLDGETEAREREMKPRQKKSPKILQEVRTDSGSQSASLTLLLSQKNLLFIALLCSAPLRQNIIKTILPPSENSSSGTNPPRGKLPKICNSAIRNASATGNSSTAGEAARARHGTRSARHRSSPGHNPGFHPRDRGGYSAQLSPSNFLPQRGRIGKVPQSRSGAAPAGDTRRRTMNFCIAVLLVLHSLPGKAEVEDDMEEIAQDLYDYVAHLSNYYYSTEDYYYDNITATPAMYMYELDSYETSTIGDVDWEKWFPEDNATTKIPGIPDTDVPGDSRDAEDSQDFQDSLGSSLQCHLTLTILLSFLGLLL